MTENIKQVLLDIIVFHALSDSEIDILLKKVKYIEYKTDDIIFKEDDMGSEMFVILEGKVDVLKHDLDGDDHLIISLYENDSFGEMTLIDIQRRSATIKCASNTKIATISNKCLLEIYHSNIKMYVKIIQNIAREFSRRLRSMDKRFVEFSQLLKSDTLKREFRGHNT